MRNLADRKSQRCERTPTLRHQIRVEKELSSIPTMAQHPVLRCRTLLWLINTRKSKFVLFLSLWFSRQNGRVRLSIPPALSERPYALRPRKKRPLDYHLLPAPYPLTRHLQFSLPQLMFLLTRRHGHHKGPRLSYLPRPFPPLPPTYPSEIIPAPHDRGGVDIYTIKGSSNEVT